VGVYSKANRQDYQDNREREGAYQEVADRSIKKR